MTDLYRRFIPKYSTIAKPLTSLLKGHKLFHWSPECDSSFVTLKNKIMSAPVLAHPDPSQMFILTTDASTVGIGAELAQSTPNGVRPVAYFSRVLTKTERKYSTYDREFLAIVMAVRHFRHHLIGTRFIVRTDHRPLQFRSVVKDPWGRRARWIAELEEYSFSVEYINGKTNKVADALSRLEPQDEYWCENDIEDGAVDKIIPDCAVRSLSQKCVAWAEDVWSTDEFREAQRRDPLLNKVYDLLKKNISASAASLSLDMKQLFKEELHISSTDILYRTNPGVGSQIVVPSKLIPEVLRLAHDEHLAGHQGSKKTLLRVLSRFWWPTVRKDVENYTQSCTVCAERMPVNIKARAPLLERPSSAKPFEVIEMDIKGPLPKTDGGYQYIFVIQDVFSRYAKMCAIRRQTADEVCKKLQEWIGRYGIPTHFHSDNCPCFVSHVFKEFCKQCGIRHSFSTPYHPQANGSVERLNRSQGVSLSKMVASHQRDWYDHLFAAQFAHNTAYHETMGDTPYRIVFKDSPRTMLRVAADLVYSESTDEHQLPTVYADQEQEKVAEMYANVESRSKQMKEARQQQYQ